MSFALRRGAILAALLLLLPIHAQMQPLTPPDHSGLEERTDLADAGDPEGALRILRFVQVSDAHVLDDDAPEPMRVGFLDPLGSEFTAASRPQEEYTDEVLASMVRALNAEHERDALDFIINTGDNVDNELENELMRFLDVWEGTHTTTGPVSGLECRPDGQSGSVDDDANDVSDQCTSLPADLAGNNTPLAPGLPWFGAFGNHDGLIQGNVPIEPSFQEIAAEYGRYFLSQREYVGMHFLAGGGCVADRPAGTVLDDNGHGFGYAGDRLCDDDPDNDGYYAFTQRGVRFVVLDTVNDDFVTGNEHLAGQFNPERTVGNDVIGGYAEGAVDPAQFEWLLGELRQHPDQLVVILSHHTPNSMFSSKAEGYCGGGQCLDDLMTEAGYKTGPDLVEALSEHPNAVAWFGGHTHQHRIQPKSVDGAPSPGFWNVETSSLIDLPQQARVVELWRTADGTKVFWTLQSIDHDYDRSRDLAATDEQVDGEATAGTPQDQEVLLWSDLPPGIRLTPQPSLERVLQARLEAPVPVGGIHGDPDEELTLTFRITDPLLETPVTGLEGNINIRHLDKDSASTVTDLETTLTDVGNGSYEASFTATTGGTHFLDLHVRDPAGLYEDLDRTLSLRMRENPQDTLLGRDKDSPAASALWGLLVLAGALAMLRRRSASR